MKKPSEVFKSIRFAKGESRDKPHSSTDNEEHYTVGEKEWGQQLQHAKKMAMQEEKKDKYDEGEYDREGDMAKSDLRSVIANAKRLHDMIEDADNLPEWCQNKITLAEDYISTVANYMTSELDEETKLEEATSAAIRMQRALQRTKEQREREQRAGEALLKPKQPVKKEEVEQLHEIGDTKKGQKLLQMVNKRAVNRLTSKKADTDPVYAKKAQQTHLAADERLKENTEQIDEIVKGEVKDDIKALDSTSFFKKHGVKKSQAKNMEEETVSEAYNTVSPSSYDDHPMVAFRKKENEKPPFDGPYKKTKGTVTDKSGAKHGPMSIARDLARKALKKQSDAIKPKQTMAKESLDESRKTDIVKEAFKKAKKKNDDTFQPEPELGSTVVKADN